MRWARSVIEWWNENYDRVFLVTAIFCGGMIVGSCLEYAQ